ncbi:MAG TPA: hypothetical protein VFX86_03620 [Candidatus Saccharimonadales bacterium]|nr:hypothetical protein [Candidatus Saccharimonadales bacterium]
MRKRYLEREIQPIVRPTLGIPPVFETLRDDVEENFHIIFAGDYRAPWPQTSLVKPKELLKRAKALRGVELRRPELIGDLKARLPKLSQTLDAVAIEADLSRSKSGRRFLSLNFDEETADELAGEHDEICGELEDMADTRSVKWPRHYPNLPLVIFNTEVADSKAQSLTKLIRSQLPIELTLAPLYTPTE